MKNFLFATATAFALFAAPVFADTFKVFGVETKAVAGSNYTVKVNPNDVIVMTGGNDTGTDAVFTQGLILVLQDLEDN